MVGPELPKKDVDAARMLRAHVEAERGRYAYVRAKWQLSYWYAQGCRRFDAFDPLRGRISPYYLDKEGNMEFQLMEMQAAMDRVQAQLASMDLRPLVEQVGTSLSQVRERAVQQIILDSILQPATFQKVVTDFTQIFTSLGCAGLHSHASWGDASRLVGTLEVVHPREIFSYPALNMDHTKQCGIIRQRVLPMDWLDQRLGKGWRRRASKEKLEFWEVNWSDFRTDSLDDSYPDVSRNPFNQVPSTNLSFGGTGCEETVEAIRIRELWLENEDGSLAEYLMASGDVVIDREAYSGPPRWSPLSFGRFMENGSFYGLGMFDLLFSINRQAEKMMKMLFNNVNDSNQMGVVAVPAGHFNMNTTLKDVGHGLKILSYALDPSAPEGLRPVVIAPHNAGDVPGKTAQFAREVMGAINPIRDLLEEKGRVDNATGLQFLSEQMTKALTNSTRAVQSVFGGAYRHLAAAANMELIRKPVEIPLTSLDLALAGAVLDPSRGTISFPENPMPDTSRLRFSVRQATPRSEVARKQEALALVAQKLMDRDQFVMLCLDENLDPAMYVEEERSARLAVISNILVLFGNGSESGQVVLTPYGCRPDFQLRYLSAFMTSPTFQKASPDVQARFQEYRMQLLQFMGLTLPNAIPVPEDAAVFGGPEAKPMPDNPAQRPPPEGAPKGGSPQEKGPKVKKDA